MGTIPKRPVIAGPYRKVLNLGEKIIPIPKVNPSVYQVLGVILSVGTLYQTHNPLLLMSMVSLILIFDWYDGATARKHFKITEEGYRIDVVIDRFSEMLIFAGLLASTTGKLFFLLSILNILLSFYSVKSGKHTSLPLRFAYLLILILSL